MPKTFRYEGLEFPVKDNTDVNFTVEYVSDGNQSITSVNVPGTLDPDIPNEGTAFIGKGASLRPGKTIVACAITNFAEVEDTIAVRFIVNGTLLQEHSNLKTEDEQPLIILHITFPVS